MEKRRKKKKNPSTLAWIGIAAAGAAVLYVAVKAGAAYYMAMIYGNIFPKPREE